MLRLLLLTGSLALLVMLFDAPRPTHNVRGEARVPNVAVVKWATRPIRSLAVDLYWVRMVNLSAMVTVPWEGKQLIAWAQFLTDLEPTFYHAYAVGGLLGTVDLGERTYNVDEAAALFQKGIAQLPQEPRLPIYLAFLQMELQRDPVAAALTLQRAAKLPSAPPYMGQLATRLMAGAGEFDTAVLFSQTLSDSDDPVTRDFFETRILEIRQEQVLRGIDDAVVRFTSAQGRPPVDLEELQRSGALPGPLPEDPLGGTFYLTPDGARATSREGRLQAHKPRNP